MRSHAPQAAQLAVARPQQHECPRRAHNGRTAAPTPQTARRPYGIAARPQNFAAGCRRTRAYRTTPSERFESNARRTPTARPRLPRCPARNTRSTDQSDCAVRMRPCVRTAAEHNRGRAIARQATTIVHRRRRSYARRAPWHHPAAALPIRIFGVLGCIRAVRCDPWLSLTSARGTRAFA